MNKTKKRVKKVYTVISLPPNFPKPPYADITIVENVSKRKAVQALWDNIESNPVNKQFGLALYEYEINEHGNPVYYGNKWNVHLVIEQGEKCLSLCENHHDIW